MSLNDLRDTVYEIAKAKGWWGLQVDVPHLVAAKLALIHSEVSEALEEVRDGQMQTYVIEGKPMGLPIELADVIIRVLDLAGALGIDMDAAIRLKIDYNKTRTHRHGGRLL